MVEGLTPRQAQILALIREHLLIHGRPPTRAEIAEVLGFRSANAAEEHLRALARKGAIDLVPGASRGIQLRGSAQAPQAGLPIVGRVAAGSPILAEEHIEDHCPVPSALFHPEAHYFLRVQGHSMRDAGILDGDLLAVHRAGTASNGQIVVARLEDEVTVKRFRRRGHQVQLIAENPDYPDIEVDLRAHTFAIEGLAVGVLRHGHPL
jgi:repressor LexA